MTKAVPWVQLFIIFVCSGYYRLPPYPDINLHNIYDWHPCLFLPLFWHFSRTKTNEWL